MSAPILTCECGAKVRVPADVANRSFRCPRCKASLNMPAATVAAAPPSSPVVVLSRPLDARGAVVCPICQTAIAVGEAAITCDTCDQVHHHDCWTEIGGCGTYGCAKAPVIDKSEHSPQTPLSAWGDTKKCPACGETIKAIALRCRYCGTDFASVDPLSVADLRQHAIAAEQTQNTKTHVVILFVVSIIGFLAPLMLVINLLYLVRKRELLAKCGPLFVIMGWAAVGLSAFYLLLMFLFFLAEGLLA